MLYVNIPKVVKGVSIVISPMSRPALGDGQEVGMPGMLLDGESRMVSWVNPIIHTILIYLKAFRDVSFSPKSFQGNYL